MEIFNMNKNAKIVMVAMFKNEAKVLRNMLNSVTKYIDFWVIQNNGSTDGSDQIVLEWAEETGIPGVLYDVEEGWVGFGWNRDHLIRKCQSIDHGCDWILKMDCDETLEVDNDFDWSPLDDKTAHAFNIPAVNGTGVYYRTWMWNSNLPWAFNHDPCHETIYCLLPEIDHAYQAVNLPVKFRQMGSNDGESWANPVKFISDALILEEKMIKEGTMLENMYHFWYVGKSYRDAYESSGFPLGKTQANEYARRCIYYFHEYINAIYKQRGGNIGIDEVCYLSLILSAEAYIFLDKKEEAILAYKQSEQFAPRRNDHLIALSRLYKETYQYDKMLEVAERMMDPERTNPFPDYCNFIDSAHYMDSPTGTVQSIYAEAKRLAGKENEIIEEQMLISEMNIEVSDEKSGENKLFMINTQPTKRFFIVDNFYSNPDAIRDYALTQVNYKEDLRWYKGMRSDTNFAPIEIKEAFEKVIGEEIYNWEDYSTNGVNGCFQIMLSRDQQVYHYDEQKWAAMIYLSPNAPFESGTRLHASKINGAHHSWEQSDIIDDAFKGDFYDSTKWNTVDSAGNVYNRLVIMDARHVHSAGSYFGNTMETGRLTHLFFFD
jgi:glycosyltransferase involved in cell wall biosynthesis